MDRLPDMFEKLGDFRFFTFVEEIGDELIADTKQEIQHAVHTKTNTMLQINYASIKIKKKKYSNS